MYSQTDRKVSEVYEESKKLAEKKIKDALDLKDFELEEEDVDLSTDEFEEEEAEIALKYEKRKAGKEELESEEFGQLECPYCGEIVDDMQSHLETCEFAPEDASVEDILPSKSKKKKKKKKEGKSKAGEEKKSSSKDKLECPYCGKNYTRLARHLPSCSKRPKDFNEEKENSYLDGKIDLDEFKEG